MLKRMAAKTEHIVLQAETKAALHKLKVIEREPYDSVIQRLLKGQSK